MKLIYMLAIASVACSTLTAGVTQLLRPEEEKSPYRILFEEYSSNPSGTAPYIEAAIAVCVPQATRVRSIDVQKMLASVIIKTFDNMRDFPNDREAARAEMRGWVQRTIIPLMNAGSPEDQKLVAPLINKVTARDKILDCIVTKSNSSLQHPEAMAKPLFSDTQLRGL